MNEVKDLARASARLSGTGPEPLPHEVIKRSAGE